MPDQVVQETDSQVAPATPQGTEPPANDPSESTPAGTGTVAAPEGLDEEFLKRLESVDPATLPVSFRQKLETPFKAEFTQKTQALAEERRRLEIENAARIEVMRQRMAEKPTGPTPEDVKRQKLKELSDMGDEDAKNQLLQMEVERQIQPIRTQVVLQNAAQTARTAPGVGQYVTQHWPEIIQTMQNDPVIAQLATANNYAAADRVMIALGLEHQVRDLMPKLEAASKEVETLKAKLSAYERERVVGLPSSTTRAGTTSGSPSAGDPKNIYDAGLRAWLESGGRAEDYR